MNAVILTSEQFEKIENELLEIKQAIYDNKSKQPLNETWLDVADTCKLLNISKRTLQNYRTESILPYSQVYGKIYFKVSDIEAHLSRHYVKAYNNR